jgi:hypothetical protein
MDPSVISFFIILAMIVGVLSLYYRTWRHPAGFQDIRSDLNMRKYRS